MYYCKVILTIVNRRIWNTIEFRRSYIPWHKLCLHSILLFREYRGEFLERLIILLSILDYYQLLLSETLKSLDRSLYTILLYKKVNDLPTRLFITVWLIHRSKRGYSFFVGIPQVIFLLNIYGYQYVIGWNIGFLNGCSLLSWIPLIPLIDTSLLYGKWRDWGYLIVLFLSILEPNGII